MTVGVVVADDCVLQIIAPGFVCGCKLGQRWLYLDLLHNQGRRAGPATFSLMGAPVYPLSFHLVLTG